MNQCWPFMLIKVSWNVTWRQQCIKCTNFTSWKFTDPLNALVIQSMAFHTAWYCLCSFSCLSAFGMAMSSSLPATHHLFLCNLENYHFVTVDWCWRGRKILNLKKSLDFAMYNDCYWWYCYFYKCSHNNNNIKANYCFKLQLIVAMAFTFLSLTPILAYFLAINEDFTVIIVLNDIFDSI